MKEFHPTSYRYKSEAEYQHDLIVARRVNEALPEDQQKEVKVRVTKDIRCTVVPYYMNATPENPKKGRRMLKIRHGSGRWYHIPARDFDLILQTLEFEVRDKRV